MGLFLDITASGVCSHSGVQLRGFVSSPIFSHPEACFSLMAAVCNALASSDFIKEAPTFASSPCKSESSILAETDAGKVLRSFCPCKVQDLDRQGNLIDWLETLTSDICLVRLQGIQKNDASDVGHVVVINGGKRGM